MMFLGELETIHDLTRVQDELEKDLKRYEAIVEQRKSEINRIKRLININTCIFESTKDITWAEERIRCLLKRESKG